MNITTIKPKFKAKPVEQIINPTLGCIYSGDAGNSEWHTGMLIQLDGDDAILRDIRGINRVVIPSTLRSVQVTR
jgi:hypothetical protein